ncbi:hypothetical protein [Prosthecomicrobium sp. N25]|uniref:hypothetical protein n=1 Tax=Prosthecomicrobium sp. N25 TaxID=3129254 RepID=UPI0030783320
MSNFWFNPATSIGVLNPPSPGQAEPIPYHYLPGSQATTSPVIANTVDKLFPFFDGVTNKLPNPPADITKSPTTLDPNEFMSWHSAYQLEYVQANGSSASGSIPGATGAQKGVTIRGAQPPITVIVSDDDQRIYVVENLAKADFSKMPLVDQIRITKEGAFTSSTGVGLKLGLTPTGTDTYLDARADAKADVDAAISAINSTHTGRLDQLAYDNPPVRNYEIFLKELNNIKTRLDNQAVFSQKDIDAQIALIKTRYDRALAFAVTTQESLSTRFPFGTQWVNVVSTDSGQTIANGFKAFMEQEKRILALDNDRLRIAATGTVADKRLDVPTLVFMLQLNYNLTVEARVIAETEEVNQQNALLQTYAVMQQIVNDVAGKFNPEETDEQRNVLGNTTDNESVSNLTVDQRKIVSMFEDALGGIAHPIESMRGADRPDEDMFNNAGNYLEKHYKTTWDSLGTRLSDTVTIINQQSQIKMNDINSLNKQKDRHFDLATGALSKLFDTIQSIGRATGG